MSLEYCPICGSMLLKQENSLKCSFCDYYRDLDKFHIDNLVIPEQDKCISLKDKKEFMVSVLNKNKKFDESEIIKNSNEIINKANSEFIENNKLNILNKFRHDLNSYEKCLNESDIEKLKNKYNMDCYNFFDELNFKEKINKFNNRIIKDKTPYILNKFRHDLNSYEKCLNESDIERLKNKYNSVCFNFFDELNFKEKIDKFNNKLIKNILFDFEEFLDSQEKYIDDSKIESLRIKYNKICYNIFDELKIKEKIDEFNTTYCDAYKDRIKERLPNGYISNSDKIAFSNLNGFKCDITQMVNEHNDEYIENQIKNNKDFFNSLLNKNLNNSIIRAILTDDNVKVLVNEDSKTFIQAKIKYLIERGNVSPSDILYISANDKYDDTFYLNKKISMKTHTFSTLAYEILRKNYNYKEINTSDLEITIRSYFEKQITKSHESMKDVVKFFLYFYPMGFFKDSNINFQTIRSVLNDLDDEFEKKYSEYYQLSNVKGKKEHVNSIMELVIANFLYIHNIAYDFSLNPLLESKETIFNYIVHDERENPEIFFLDGTKYILNEIDPEYICEKSSCYSNFYLPEYDIYIDLLNLNNYFQNNSINSENKSPYIEEINNFNKESKTKIITILDDIDDVVSILKSLKENLKKFSVDVGEVNYPVLYEFMILNNKLPEYEFFIKTMEQFIKSFKSNTIYLDDDKNNIMESTVNKYLKENDKLYFKSINLRNKFFLNVFKHIYLEYDSKLKKKELIDNNDIINYAIFNLKKGEKIHDYKYIFVDEYQNMSYSKLNLLKEIQNKTNAKIIAIGDDCQPSSIFPTNDVNLFINFDKYFMNSKTVKIQNTPDNSKECSNRIQKNEKIINSYDDEFDNQIKLVGYISKAEEVLSLINIFKNIHEEDNNAEILIIGRNRNDLKEIYAENLFTTYEEDHSIKIVYKKLPNLKIEYKTIFESKNLKRDYVIILNLNDKVTGFPNKIENDLVLNFISNNDENMIYPEERRLFYFALTRSKKDVYLFYNEINPSIFLEEIKNLPYVERLDFTFSNEEIHEIYSKFNQEFDIIKTNNFCPKCNSGNINLVIDNKNKSFKLKCSKFCGWDVEKLRTKKCSYLCKKDMDKLGMPQFNTYFLHKYVKRDWRKGEYKGNPIDVEVSKKIIDYKHKNKSYAIQLFTEELMNAITYLSYYKMNKNIKKIGLLVVPSGDEYEAKSKYEDFTGYRLAKSVKLIHQWYEKGITKNIFGLNKEIIDLKHSFIRVIDVGSSWKYRDNPILHSQSIECEGIPDSKEDIAFIILDDITTSGSSMVGCKQVLLDEGINSDNIFTLTIGATVRNVYGKI